ncbi:MAG: lysostaphin resistance A-like protein [Methylococcales bacterium]
MALTPFDHHKIIVRIVIAIVLVAEIVHSWGFFDKTSAPATEIRKLAIAELEVKLARRILELEARIFVGGLFFVQELDAKSTEGSAFEARIRPMVAQALHELSGQQEGNALVWFLRYQIAIGLVFDFDTQAAQWLTVLFEQPFDDASGQSVDRALERVVYRQPLGVEDAALLSRELGTAGKALVMQLGKAGDAGGELRRQILTEFHHLAFIVMLFVAALLLGLFFTLFYGFVLVFGLARRHFACAAFESESLLWTWGAYLGVMFAAGTLLPHLSAIESIDSALRINLGVILGTLVLVTLPVLAGASWPAVREAIGLEIHNAGSLFKDICIGPTFYLASLFPLFVFLMLFSLLLTQFNIELTSATHPIVFTFINPDQEGVRAFIVVLAVVIAPCVEEIMFRGVLYAWFRCRFGAVLSVAITSLIFALVHPQGIIGVPVLFLIGSMLGILREWRGNLVAPILYHACLNGGTMLLLTTMLRAQ